MTRIDPLPLNKFIEGLRQLASPLDSLRHSGSRFLPTAHAADAPPQPARHRAYRYEQAGSVPARVTDLVSICTLTVVSIHVSISIKMATSALAGAISTRVGMKHIA